MTFNTNIRDMYHLTDPIIKKDSHLQGKKKLQRQKNKKSEYNYSFKPTLSFWAQFLLPFLIICVCMQEFFFFFFFFDKSGRVISQPHHAPLFIYFFFLRIAPRSFKSTYFVPLFIFISDSPRGGHISRATNACGIGIPKLFG